MTIDKDRLKALAEAAPSGPWVSENYSLYGIDNGYTRHMLDTEPGIDCGDVGYYAALEFIAAANPETVLGLLAEIERLETESREAKDAKNGLGWAINELRGSFKNFHRSLCARFGYVHDEKDWFRDQVSLQEHVAGQIDQLKAENEALRKIISDAATACGASVSVECTPEFMANLPAEISVVVGGLRKDAERYRWLREPEIDVAIMFGGHAWEDLCSEYIDLAIDAAMSKERGQ